jgi:phosphoribosylformylglycinamidine (FGAM) synthase PurS component
MRGTAYPRLASATGKIAEATRRAGSLDPLCRAAYTLLEMAMAYAVQRLEIGDVVLIDLDEEATEVEAKVIRPIERTETTVRAWLRVEGREDFIREWPVGEQVTVVRGP